jgi:hypothetical protein
MGAGMGDEQEQAAGVGSEPDPRYVKAWRRMRTSRLGTLLTVLVWFAASMVYIPVRRASHLRSLAIDWWVLGAWLLVLIVVSIPIRAWVRVPCPRCGKAFGFPKRTCSWRNSTSARQCVHCGLPRGAERDPDADGGGDG